MRALLVLATAFTLLIGCTLPGVPSEAEKAPSYASQRQESPDSSLIQGLINMCATDGTFFIDYEDRRYTYKCISDKEHLHKSVE